MTVAIYSHYFFFLSLISSAYVQYIFSVTRIRAHTIHATQSRFMRHLVVHWMSKHSEERSWHRGVVVSTYFIGGHLKCVKRRCDKNRTHYGRFGRTGRAADILTPFNYAEILTEKKKSSRLKQLYTNVIVLCAHTTGNEEPGAGGEGNPRSRIDPFGPPPLCRVLFSTNRLCRSRRRRIARFRWDSEDDYCSWPSSLFR